nr:kunitz trypsin inhibitor 2 [Ipomoea batatas]
MLVPVYTCRPHNVPKMRALLLLLFVTFSFEFVPFALSSRMLPSSSSSDNAVVVDFKGGQLKLGEPYYVLSPASTQPAEGLCLDDIKSNETSTDCPHNVVQCTMFYKSILGMPIIFSSPDNTTTTTTSNSTTDDNLVKENTSYKIQFSGVTGSCAKETVWGLTFEHDTTCEFVTTDPAAPPVEFQLKKQGSGYAIVYCEIIPLPRIPVCFSVGFHQFGMYYSRLVVGLDIEAVEFFFVKKTTNVTALPHASS